MNTQAQILAQYEASKVEGRSNWCPRKGIYKILSTEVGICLGKPSLMAEAKWKASFSDNYSELTFKIQLESFRSNADAEQQVLFNSGQIKGLEIAVEQASYSSSTKSFKLTWRILLFKSDLEILNEALNSGNIDLNTLNNDEIDIEEDWGDDY